MIPKEKLTEVLEGFNVWNYVPDRQLFYKSLSVLIIVFICFAAVPPSLVSLDIIAMTGGITLVILSKLNGREILNRVDLELIFYLLGIFVITGAMELLGVIGLVGDGLAAITGGNSFVTVITVLWASAFRSGPIIGVPISSLSRINAILSFSIIACIFIAHYAILEMRLRKNGQPNSRST